MPTKQRIVEIVSHNGKRPRAYILKHVFDRQEALLTADLDKEASDIEAHVDVKHSILKYKADGDDIGLGAVAHEKRAVRHGQQQFVCRLSVYACVRACVRT